MKPKQAALFFLLGLLTAAGIIFGLKYPAQAIVVICVLVAALVLGLLEAIWEAHKTGKEIDDERQ